MLPFTLQFESGRPVYEQVLFAAKKAIICGQLKPGDPFPSVRVLSQELRINPNTAQKVTAGLRAEGLIEMTPGLGSVVTRSAYAGKSQRKELLGRELERLVVEAKKLQLSEEDVTEALKQHWWSLSENKK
jgi:GntR family transcriptional regulator